MSSSTMAAHSYATAASSGTANNNTIPSQKDYSLQYKDLYHPQPTSMTLLASLYLLDSPLSPYSSKPSTPNGIQLKDEHYVFLLPGQYLQNWMCWAYHQPVAAEEADRVKLALRMAADAHSLISPEELSGTYHDPGPLDATPLSVLGHPLLLRPNVKVGRREVGPKAESGSAEPNIAATTPIPLARARSFNGRAFSSSAISTPDTGINSNNTSNRSKPQELHQMDCCAVPESFYELLRSVHGVVCDDGFSVSFQKWEGSNAATGAMHHHVLTSRQKSPKHNSSVPPPRPVEFRRRVLFVLQSEIPTRSVDLKSPFKKLMEEERYKNPELVPVVELYPIKFFYSVVDGNQMNGIPSKPPPPLAENEVQSIDGNPNTIDLLNAAATDLRIRKPPIARFKSHSGAMMRRGESMSAPGSPRFGTPVKERDSNIENKVEATDRSLVPSDLPETQFPPLGFVLISRTTLVSDALKAVIEEIAPNKSSSCVRVWSKMDYTYSKEGEDLQENPSSGGDGYELVDLDTIDGKLPSKKGKPKADRTPTLKVADWVQRQTGNNITRAVSILVETRSSLKSKWPRRSLELESRLKVGDYVDAQDTTGNWYEAIIRKITDDSITVHYAGWASRWDATIPLRPLNGEKPPSGVKRTCPPQPLWSQTSRWRENIQVGQAVEVRESSSLVQRPKWFRAIVKQVGGIDDNVRELVAGAELEALEDDTERRNGNPFKKKHPLLLLKRKRQVLVEVPQEKNTSTSTPPLPVHISSTSATLTPQSPSLRWVNLYGEEICKVGTHLEKERDPNRPATVDYSYDTRKPPVEVLKSFNNVHGAGFVRESLRGIPPAPGSVGLHNLGNSCFLNSIVQCLNHIEPLTQYFLKGKYVQDLNQKNPLGSGGRVAVAYASLLSEMWGGEYSTLAPRLLKQTVASFAPQFNNVYQHDSQEFCSFLMDGIHEDLNRVKEKPYVEELEGFGMKDEVAAIESWRKHLQRHDSVIVDLCQGMHRNHVTCPLCGKESIKFDVYSTISLSLPETKGRAIKLEDCFELFEVGEQLDEQNSFYCRKCKKHVCALKLIALWSVPDILIIHLKRFTFEQCKQSGKMVRSKIEDHVEFPIDNLDMRPYVLGPIDENAPPIYKLFGVSEHTGVTANSGHYTATVRNSRDGKWYRYNDSNVGLTSGEASVTGGAYVLFYQRAKGASRWGGMEKVMNSMKGTIGTEGADADGFQTVKSKKRNKKKDK